MGNFCVFKKEYENHEPTLIASPIVLICDESDLNGTKKSQKYSLSIGKHKSLLSGSYKSNPDFTIGEY